MDAYTEAIRCLPPAEKLLLVERTWDDLAAEGIPIPLPEWAIHEAARRCDEMRADACLGLTHDEIWKRIQDSRDGQNPSLPPVV